MVRGATKTRRWSDGLGILLLSAAGACRPPPEPAPLHDVEGTADVRDGDTLWVGGKKIRLWAVDAPELHQTCRDARGAPYACGEVARRRLEERVRGAAVACDRKDVDRYGRLVARCFVRDPVGQEDLGRWLVREGLALAYRKIDPAYVLDEAAARAAGRGVWAGEIEPPWQWRREHER